MFFSESILSVIIQIVGCKMVIDLIKNNHFEYINGKGLERYKVTINGMFMNSCNPPDDRTRQVSATQACP